jgi:hypothetical protein
MLRHATAHESTGRVAPTPHGELRVQNSLPGRDRRSVGLAVVAVIVVDADDYVVVIVVVVVVVVVRHRGGITTTCPYRGSRDEIRTVRDCRYWEWSSRRGRREKRYRERHDCIIIATSARR